MKIKNLILCAALALLAVGCGQSDNNNSAATTANTNMPGTNNISASTNVPASTNH
jgi:ABC-type Fe3+-citrate transport system substrate-binding protein